ncbi:DUF6875 domain-containing protein [Nocardia sp. NPDC057663]|uniref:DUF6875 domain-containing protein n=1 Tax=Nocardia sp. NPDC057663 TaxID=3346201 RepID=UPI00366B5028
MTEVIFGSRSGMSWLPLSTSGENSRCTQEMLDRMRTWAKDYLTQPLDEIGRDGPVCPYVRPSMRRDLIWVGRVAGVQPWPAYVRLVLSDALELFPKLPPDDGGAAVLRCMVTALPDLHDYSLIDDLHDELKSEFVERGLMLGQFYPGCSQPGLWNKDYHPLDAPIPMLVVRTMMATDFPFLLSRPEWMSAYVKKFAPALPAHVRNIVVDRLIAGTSTEVPEYHIVEDREPLKVGAERRHG